jgi:hypothetical protein
MAFELSKMALYRTPGRLAEPESTRDFGSASDFPSNGAANNYFPWKSY